MHIDKLDERIISPDKLKDIFDKMTVIDTNPNDSSSKKFDEQLTKMERENTNKKQGHITIKTMRRGKVRNVSQERFETDSAGRINMLDKRVIRYHEHSFQQTNFVPVQVKEGSSDISLATYKQPALKGTPKARVMFIHGLHDYAGRYAYLAQKFAQAGYDFVAMDQRGHGASQGKPGYFESISEQLVDDQLSFLQSCIEHDGEKPTFILAAN